MIQHYSDMKRVENRKICIAFMRKLASALVGNVIYPCSNKPLAMLAFAYLLPRIRLRHEKVRSECATGTTSDWNETNLVSRLRIPLGFCGFVCVMKRYVANAPTAPPAIGTKLTSSLAYVFLLVFADSIVP